MRLPVALFAAVLCLDSPVSGDEAAESAPHLDPQTYRQVESALVEGRTALLKLQKADGSFGGEDYQVPAIPRTALVLWALCESDQSQRARVECKAALQYLLSFEQSDGGIYDPELGLVRYTAGVVRQALEAYDHRYPDPALTPVIERLNLFVYQNRDPESLEETKRRVPPGEANAKVDEVLRREDVSSDVRNALEFLRKAREKPTDRPPRRPPGKPAARDDSPRTISYDELLRYVCESARLDNPTVTRVYRAIRASYDASGNPDLTKRYGPEGFQKKDAGLYYYYLTLARTLGALGRTELRTDDGKKHDWAADLSDRLLLLRRPDGLWANANGRWWEDDPVLATSFAMLSLTVCRDLKKKL